MKEVIYKERGNDYWLTEGRSYKVLEEYQFHYQISNDIGDLYNYPKKLFEDIKEYRKRKLKTIEESA